MTTETTSWEQITAACAAVSAAEDALKVAVEVKNSLATRLGTAMLAEHGITPGETTFSRTRQHGWKNEQTKTDYYRVTNLFHGYIERNWKTDEREPQINVYCEAVTKAGTKHRAKSGTRFTLGQVIHLCEVAS